MSIKKNILIGLCLLFILVNPYLSSAHFIEGKGDKDSLSNKVEYFKLRDVRLLKSPFKKAQDVDLSYILKLSPDRLLAPYLKEAGLQPTAKNYPNWESQGLDGHIAGHYLSALSMMYASTGKRELLDRVRYMVDELKRCQEQDSSGYIGGIPNGKEMWKQVAAGEVEAVKDRWVPWYNVHKIFCGLRDAYLFAGSREAKEVLIKLSDWCWQETHNLSDSLMQKMLQTEYGGMDKVLADLYVITGNKKYLKLAERFSKRSLLDPLLKKEDKLTGLHANTQIPVVLGFERIAGLTGNGDWQRAAGFFWNMVVHHRSLAFGGNSVAEHFNPIDDFSKLIVSPQGPETCNTYNMLKLTRMLYQESGSPSYIDFYERALYNHILSSENRKKGGFVYFTPARPRHYRVFSQPETSFWCCVGSGMENHSKYGGTIYAHAKDALYVNLFIPSELNWKEKGVKVIQENHFPDEDQTHLKIETEKPITFTLKIRYPSWVKKDRLQIFLNGKKQKIQGNPGTYVSLRRKWQEGDQIKVVLPMHFSMVPLPGSTDFVSLKYGPVILAARTGTKEMKGEFADTGRMSHIASGPLFSIKDAPKLVGSRSDILSEIKRVKRDTLVFEAPAAIYPEKYKDLKLIPFFRIGGARYMMYWQQTTKNNMKKALAVDEKLDERKGE